MSRNQKFIKSETTLAWLGQFEPRDQEIAAQLLRSMILVSRDEFFERLRSLILSRSEIGGGPIGLYAEREVPRRNGRPHGLFKQTRTKVKRAFGVGPRPVESLRRYAPDTGSEGIVAQLISELCREFPNLFYDHPGPEVIRDPGIRTFLLVTDFIGSGQRALSYLDAAWRVRSVRSWWSRRARRGLRFEVVSYSATSVGRKLVSSHASQPSLNMVVECPTIGSVFRGANLHNMLNLCLDYDPVRRDRWASLGHGDIGALIAFAHGCPNNAPRLLHKKGRSWVPLFAARVTSAGRQHFSHSPSDEADVRARLTELRQIRLAQTPWLQSAKPHSRVALLLLASLSHPPRTDETLSRKTGLTILEIRQAVVEATKSGWIDDRRRLTDLGQGELAAARRGGMSPSDSSPLPEEGGTLYYPTSLRGPSQVSS